MLDMIDFGRDRCIVLDVGASVGGFAGNILLRAPLAEVHCFEPNPGVIPKLEANARRYGNWKGQPRCIINTQAVGSHPGREELLVTSLAVASSLLPVSDASRRGWPQADFTELHQKTVEVIRLDEYLAARSISSVKLLKLDVQGYELNALRGCGERLRDIDYIVAEVQFQPLYERAPLWDEIVSYTAQFGFSPVVMDGFCFGPDGQPLQADILLHNQA